MLTKMQKLVIKKRNVAVIRDEVDKLTQDRGEGIRRFVGKLYALFNVGEFTAKCVHCDKVTPYEDEVVKTKMMTAIAIQILKKMCS